MRSILVYCIGIFVATCLLLTGCKLSSSTTAPVAVSFDTIQLDTVCPLFSSYSRPACHLTLFLQSANAKTSEEVRGASSRFISSLVAKGSEDCEPSADLQQMSADLCSNYILRYLSEGKDAINNYDGDVEAAANWMSYELNISGESTYCADNFLSYEVRNESYEGGAHGSIVVSCGVFNLISLQPVYFNDVFSESCRASLAHMMLDRLSEDCGGLSTEEMISKGLLLSEAAVEPSDNFVINASGIEWVFNPFEIAPFSLGVIRILLSWDAIHPYIDEQSPLLDIANKYSQYANE